MKRARFPRCEIRVAALPASRWSSMSQKFDVSAIMSARGWRAIVNPRNEWARSPFNKYDLDYAICFVSYKLAEFERPRTRAFSTRISCDLLRKIVTRLEIFMNRCEFMLPRMELQCVGYCNKPSLNLKSPAECQVSWKN